MCFWGRRVRPSFPQQRRTILLEIGGKVALPPAPPPPAQVCNFNHAGHRVISNGELHSTVCMCTETLNWYWAFGV